MLTQSAILRACLSILASASLLPGVHAETGAPIYLQANTIHYDHVSGLSNYRGKVRLTRADLYIRADKATVRQHENEVATVNASGQPIVLRKGATNAIDLTVIRGERLEFDAVNNTVVITGNVITTRGRDTIRSTKLTYHLDDNHIIADRDNNASPVVAELRPRPKVAPK